MLPAVPSSSIASSTLSRLCAGSPMPMNTTFFTGAPRARERDLRHHLRAAELAHEAVAAGHAEHAADRAADLRRDAQAVARQQHALHRLAVGERDQQALGAVGAGMRRTQARERRRARFDRGQRRAQRLRQEIFDAPLAAGLRQRLRPQPQHAMLVIGPRTGGAQALLYVFNFQ